MKKTSWLFSAAVFATCFVSGAWAFDDGYEPGISAKELAEMTAKHEAQLTGPSWLIYRMPTFAGDTLMSAGLGQQIYSVEAIEDILEVTVQKPYDSLGVNLEVFKVKYSSVDRAKDAEKDLKAGMEKGTGLSLEVSGCLKLSEKPAYTSSWNVGDEHCEQQHFTFTVACEDAKYTATPRLKVRQKGMLQESPSSGNALFHGETRCTGPKKYFHPSPRYQ